MQLNHAALPLILLALRCAASSATAAAESNVMLAPRCKSAAAQSLRAPASCAALLAALVACRTLDAGRALVPAGLASDASHRARATGDAAALRLAVLLIADAAQQLARLVLAVGVDG